MSNGYRVYPPRNETPVRQPGPAFLMLVHLRDRMSGVWGEADVVRDAPNDRL